MSLKIKNADATNRFLAAMGLGSTDADPFFSIPADFYTEVKKGNVPGHSIINRSAINSAAPDGTYEGILEMGANFTFVTAAATVRVKSGGNAADTAAGAGAQAVTVEGLDDTGVFLSESIELAGASASSVTTGLFWRTDNAYITPLRAGAYGVANTAAIMIENGTGGTDLINIVAGEGRSQYGAYAVPLSTTGYLISATLIADSAKDADFKLFTRAALTDFATPFAPKIQQGHWNGIIGSYTIPNKAPILTMPALTDIWFEAQGVGAITEVGVDFEILLVDD